MFCLIHFFSVSNGHSVLQGDEEKQRLNLPINQFAQMVQEVGGLDKIEALQNHSNNEIYEHAVVLLETFFEAEV